jgi:hypothetical protein
MQYDMPLQITAERGIRDFYFEKLDSSIYHYKKLLLLKPEYYQGHYNIARAYAKNKDYINAILSIEKYVKFSKEECRCSYLNNSDFENICDTAFNNSKRKCCEKFEIYVKEKKLTKPALLLQLENYVGKEQEVLGDRHWNGKNRERDSILKINFLEFTQIVDTINFPTETEIGKGVGSVSVIILHADYFPSIQNSLGQKLLKLETKGYDPKTAAYIIDRSLRNMNKPQLYGTILIKKNGKDYALYDYDDIEKLKERRKNLCFQPIEDYMQNLSITK